MSTSDFQLTEDKYLFTFQDETKLWISKEFIEKYPQLPFRDIIQHSEEYDDGSYYIDIPYYPMDKVIQFLMEDNVDIFSLNLKESYDIYKTFIEYSVTIDNKKQHDLLFHVEKLFFNYLKENNYSVFKQYGDDNQLNMPIDLHSSDRTRINIKGLINTQRKNELLNLSLLTKMMNVADVFIEYDYASNIPIEYICPSCIQDIFPSIENIYITVTSSYKKSEILLEPYSDEYSTEYDRLFYSNKYKDKNPENYDYYTNSEVTEYNKIFTENISTIHNHKFIISYNGKRRMSQIPKLYKYITDDAIYTTDYSKVEINQINDKNKKEDRVRIQYSDNKKETTFIIDKFSSEWGISQLLHLFSYLNISKIDRGLYDDSKYKASFILKTLEEWVFDSLSILSVKWIKELTEKIDYSLFMKTMATRVFPNVTKLIYDDDDESFQLSSIKKECFPKLHIIQYEIDISISSFNLLFPLKLMSMIDIVRINKIDYGQEEGIAIRLEKIAFKYSIHINIISLDARIFSSNSDNIKKLDCFKNYKQHINNLDIIFKNRKEFETDVNSSLERFLKSDIFQHLNDLIVNFNNDNINIEYLKNISNIFNDIKINTIHKLTIEVLSINGNSSTEYLTAIENILEKLIPKVSIIRIENCTMTFINQLTLKGCFQNTTQLTLQSIRSDDDYIYDPDTSILQYKYSTNSYIDTIIGTNYISKYEVETLFDCIKENKTENLRSLIIYIYDEDHLSKLIQFIITGKIPKLKEFMINIIRNTIKNKEFDAYKQKLDDSSFIQKNHVYYEFKKVN
ncbi:hypothetical protein WA158_000744 [Blastocystis sp. Blastoise]